MFTTTAKPLRAIAWRMPLKLYRRLTVATTFCVWALIVLGGAVRVTGSGTGCGESWPLCGGHLFPALEYHQMVEWNHRLFATLVGLLMVVTVGSTLIWFRQSKRLVVLAILAGATYIGQALLGGATVLLHLDHSWVAAHMGNSMVLLGSLVLLVFHARTAPLSTPMQSLQRASSATVHLAQKPKIRNRLRLLALATAAFTYAAMLTGSAVVGADADLACPAWPQCSSGTILPSSYEAWISFGHRIAVGFSDVLMLLLTLLIWRFSRQNRPLRVTAHTLALLYISQVFLGAFTVWLGAPEWLKGAHLALAAATWAALVLLAATLWHGTTSAGEVGMGGSASTVRRNMPRQQASGAPAGTPRVYFELIKPRVIPLLLVPTVAAMLMAAVQYPADRPLLGLVLWTMLGGTLATGGAHAINQCLDRDIDARMRRTKHRAVVTGRVSPGSALLFGIALTMLALVQLWLTVNPVAALLALGGNLFYVFVYTLWLKRSSVQNIVIGGAAGAVPPLVGWAAVTGSIDISALLFFAIIFFWTPAHFWALALVRQEDYRAAGVPMLPVVRGAAYTRSSIVRYSLLLFAVSLLPFAVRSLSWLYLVAAVSLGLWFVARAVQLAQQGTTARAWGLFKFSNMYLALLYFAMVADRLLALSGGWHL